MPETLIHNQLRSVNGQAEKLRGMMSSLRRMLFYRPTDDLLSLRKNLSVAIEKGKLSFAFGEKSYTKPSIKEVKDYPFQKDEYPLPKDLRAALVTAVNELGAGDADISLSIPKDWTVIRTVDFPATIKENVSGTISHELDRITPYTADDAFYDFRILSQESDRMTILVMATKADAIRPYLNAVRESGREISRVTINLSGLGTVSHYFDDTSDSIFLAIDENKYEGAWFVNGIIAQTVSNKFTSDSAADKVTAVSNDINSLIDKSQALGNSQGTSVIIQDNDHSLRELIKDQINRHVTFIGGSDETLRSDPADIPFRAACGSVLQSLWPGAAAFDLLSRGRHEEPKVPVALTVVLLAALVIALALFLTLPLKADKEQLQALSHEIQVKEKEYKEVETLQKEISGLESEVIFIRNFNTGTSSLAILNELTQLLPGTAWLSNVTITESTVSIVGFADSATELLPKLETSGFFGKVEFASPTFKSGNLGKERFNIKMVLEEQNKGKEEKTANAKK